MCTDPQTKNGHSFACRVCDECIATRRHGWVARAMAEKTQFPHALCVCLTYSDHTQEGRDGAAMFAYHHVSDFLKRLRAASERAQPGSKIRFLCAGEQGDRNGRCHWHLILFSDLDLRFLGEVKVLAKGKREKTTDPQMMMTVGKRKRRLNWSQWPLGFCTFQQPDQGGMSYVLTYCLKDQFTHQKSKGTMREAHVENFATGLFRMSKRPAIGERYLWGILEALNKKGAVLPSLKIQIPDFSGYWHPHGNLRKMLLWGMVAINQRVLWATGANAPQWPSLLASCGDNETDLGVLKHVPTIETEEAIVEAFRARARPQREESDWSRDSLPRPSRSDKFSIGRTYLDLQAGIPAVLGAKQKLGQSQARSSSAKS